MKLLLFFDKLFKSVFSILVIILFTFNYDTSILNASTMNNYAKTSIVEELRLSVPKEYKNVWFKAEKEIWEPWLAKQEGFISRDIFYNEEKAEALLLVNWESKILWKKISPEEVNLMQDLYEEKVKEALNLSKNPFELIYEGELFQQK